MDHPIPEAALDADIAILGRKGGGKTFTAKGIVERLLDLRRRVLVLDPLGVWAGLRTSADGESPGYPVTIFGGAHGDLPLDAGAAAPMAEILATENVPAVIDLSDLSKYAQQGFLLKFLHELRRVNKEALSLVLEEADVFSPQNPQGDDSKMLHAEIDWIARRGRFKGFRLISITQRPARLSKDVLTQAGMLVVHRLPAPQDRDAVKAWVEGNGDRDLARQVFDTLAQLAVGEAWVWSPENNLLARSKFPLIKTLDTSATPKAGEKRIEPKTLAEVDISKIKEALAASTEEEDTDEPKTKAPDSKALLKAHADGVAKGREEGFHEADSIWRRNLQALLDERDSVSIGEPPKKEVPATREEAIASGHIGRIPGTAPPAPNAVHPLSRSAPARAPHAPRPAGANPLVLAATAIWPAKLTWEGLCATDNRKAHGGSFNVAKRQALDEGLLREEAGLVVLVKPPKTNGAIPADLLEQRLPTATRDMFVEVRRKPAKSWEELMQRLGKAAHGGSFNVARKMLLDSKIVLEDGGKLTTNPNLERAA